MKNSLLLFFLMASASHACHSQDTSGKSSSTRLIISQGRSDSLAMHLPLPGGMINDFARLLTNSEVKALDSIVTAFEKETTVEIAVATVNSSMVKDEDFEDYTLVMMRTWGIGKKEKNNGILIVICPDLRRIRIQNGYGIENILPDSETKYIVDNSLLPQLKKGNYFEGIRDGIFAIIKKLKQNGL